MADQITGTVCQDSLHWTRETESKSINSSFTCLHEPLKDNQYWAANAMFSLWNQWNTAPVRSEVLPSDERDTGSSVGRRVTVLATALAMFAQGNKTLSSQSLRCWKHHCTKSPESKATSVQKAGGKPAVAGNPSPETDTVIKWELSIWYLSYVRPKCSARMDELWKDLKGRDGAVASRGHGDGKAWCLHGKELQRTCQHSAEWISSLRSHSALWEVPAD